MRSRQLPTVNDMSDLGWAGLLTTHSTMNNVSGAGTDRVNVQSAEQDALTGVKGITEDIAKAIIASRGQNRLRASLTSWTWLLRAIKTSQARPVAPPFSPLRRPIKIRPGRIRNRPRHKVQK